MGLNVGIEAPEEPKVVDSKDDGGGSGGGGMVLGADGVPVGPPTKWFCCRHTYDEAVADKNWNCWYCLMIYRERLGIFVGWPDVGLIPSKWACPSCSSPRRQSLTPAACG